MANDRGVGLGLRPLDQPFGTQRVRYYKAETSQAIYRFQPVTMNASGYVGNTSNQCIAPILGVAVGFSDMNKASLPSGITALDKGAYLPASTDAYIAVIDDPTQLYVVEEGTGGTTLTKNDIGVGVVLTYLATTGDTTTGIANLVISQSSATTTTACNFQLVGPAENMNSDGTYNQTDSASCKWVVRIASHQNGPIGLNITR